MINVSRSVIRGLVIIGALGATPIAQSKGQSPGMSTRPTGLDSLCIDIHNSYECAQIIEKHQLSKPQIARVVTRTPTGLRLRLLNGKTLAMQNREEGDSVRRFSFREYPKGVGYFVLHRQLYEGADYLLVHARSGEQFVLQERPVISPDRLRIVTASAGLSGMSNGNAVQIWRLQPRRPELEFELSPRDWEPSEPKWLDSKTIRLRQQAPHVGEGRAFSRSVDLVRRQGKWKLGEPLAP
jgi:hypothetical protein